MITLLGGTGYIGAAFAAELKARGEEFELLSRKSVDYTRFDVLLDYLKSKSPEFLVNAAGFTGKPNVDQCEIAKADTLQGNTLFPQTIASACAVAGVSWGHVSSGCIYAGAKVEESGQVRTEKELTKLGIEKELESGNVSTKVIGFTEENEPNFSFRNPPCSFYSGTKALGEEVLLPYLNPENKLSDSKVYIWRLRIPFDEIDNNRNFLSKLQRYPKVYNNVNSVSHRRDYVKACIDTWKVGAPSGIYNVTNPGFVTSRQVVRKIQEILKLEREFEFWEDNDEFYSQAAKTPRSNCVMDSSKLERVGVKIRSVDEALEDALKNWKPEA